eukprot:553642-Rhodomonas_salina.1
MPSPCWRIRVITSSKNKQAHAGEFADLFTSKCLQHPHVIKESWIAVPLLIQWSASNLPDLRSMVIMYDGRSRVPVRIG